LIFSKADVASAHHAIMLPSFCHNDKGFSNYKINVLYYCSKKKIVYQTFTHFVKVKQASFIENENVQ